MEELSAAQFLVTLLPYLSLAQQTMRRAFSLQGLGWLSAVHEVDMSEPVQ